MVGHPDFPEGQLQQLVNTECAIRTSRNPVVISPREEFAKGWDTGFSLPWLGAGAPDQYGCNLFLQYKLASLIGSQGGNFGFWNAPYHQFEIPVARVDANARFAGFDFHQFDQLKKLSDRGFSVNYVTNSTLLRVRLFEMVDDGSLLDNTPTFSISDIKTHHRFVTFHPPDRVARYHSEPSLGELVPFSELLQHSRQLKPTSLRDDLRHVTEFILEVEKEIELHTERTFRNAIELVHRLPDQNWAQSVQSMLAGTFLERYLDLYWYRFATSE